MDEPDIPFDLDGPSTSAQAASAAEEAGRPDEVLAVSGGLDGRKVWLVKVRRPSSRCGSPGWPPSLPAASVERTLTADDWTAAAAARLAGAKVPAGALGAGRGEGQAPGDDARVRPVASPPSLPCLLLLVLGLQAADPPGHFPVPHRQPGEANPRISLILPTGADAAYDTTDLVTEYDLSIIPDAADGERRSTGYLLTDTKRDARQRRACLPFPFALVRGVSRRVKLTATSSAGVPAHLRLASTQSTRCSTRRSTTRPRSGRTSRRPTPSRSGTARRGPTSPSARSSASTRLRSARARSPRWRAAS